MTMGLSVLIFDHGATEAQAAHHPMVQPHWETGPFPGPLPAGPSLPFLQESEAPAVDTRNRQLAFLSDDAKSIARLAKRLRARGSEVDNPCLLYRGVVCQRHALDSFFEALDRVEKRQVDAKATVVTFGNSLSASDHIVDKIRERLVETFGDGGRGFVYADLLTRGYGRRSRTGRGSAGWQIQTILDEDLKSPPPFGMGGGHHMSTRKGEKTRWKTEGASRARIFFMEGEKSAGFTLKADGQDLQKVEAEAAARHVDRVVQVDLPPEAKTLELEAHGPELVIYGATLERPNPGVIVDTAAVVATDATYWLKTDEGVMSRQLAAQDPSLVILMLGGNEIKRLAWGKSTLEQIRRDHGLLIERAHKAVPTASCLTVGPIDSVVPKNKEDPQSPLIPRHQLNVVNETLREVSLQQGCAFFDLYEAMGGHGSIDRLRKIGLVHDDMVHPKRRGLDLLGQLVAQGLLDSYAKTPAATITQAAYVARPPGPILRVSKAMTDEVVPLPRRPLQAPAGPAGLSPSLARFFKKLHDLEAGRQKRVAIGMFGASHTAGHKITDHVRGELAKRFGQVGRGYVSVGRPSALLHPGGVERAVEGNFNVLDGRETEAGTALSPAGIRAEFQSGARFGVTFCHTCPPAGDRTPGYVELAWLPKPDMPEAVVKMDDKKVGHLSPGASDAVQFLNVPVVGERHTLSVEVAGQHVDPPDGGIFEGPAVGLLSVVQEMQRPGVLLDPVALPGTTAMTIQNWDQETLRQQVARRKYDLVVLAWGTNESAMREFNPEEYKKKLEATLALLTSASPGADCMFFSATDAFVRKNRRLIPAPNHDEVDRLQREAARQWGCAFYSPRIAMGGPGSMKSWIARDLGHRDHTHFTLEGYHRLADLWLMDILALYERDHAKWMDWEKKGTPAEGEQGI
jgi:lysophospholipase L1-like esterase